MATYTEIQEGAALSAQLVNDHTIGAMARAAQIVGGQDLMDSSAELLASVGVDLSSTGGAFESGQILAKLSLPAVRSGLSRISSRFGRSVLANPAQWGKALAFTAAGAGTYSFLSTYQQGEVEKNHQKAALLAQTLETLSPADRLKIAKILAEGISGNGAQVSPYVWGALAVGAAGLLLFWKR